MKKPRRLNLFDRVRLKMMMPNLDKYKKKYSDDGNFEEKYVVMSKEEFNLLQKLGKNLESHLTQIKLNNQEIRDLKETNRGMVLMIESVLKQSEQREVARKKAVGKVGGLTASLNKEKAKKEKLKEEVKELKDKLEESMTDKYLVKKIPSGRRPRTQVMKIKNCTVQSNIAKKMFERGK